MTDDLPKNAPSSLEADPLPIGEDGAWFTPTEIATMLGCETMDEFWGLVEAGQLPMPEPMNDTIEPGWYSTRH